MQRNRLGNSGIQAEQGTSRQWSTAFTGAADVGLRKRCSTI
ncbi:hypothetical protein [Lentilactobacillus buchneri]|nr:hypothetical protein [Lentilactobacillus buchneri]